MTPFYRSANWGSEKSVMFPRLHSLSVEEQGIKSRFSWLQNPYFMDGGFLHVFWGMRSKTSVLYTGRRHDIWWHRIIMAKSIEICAGIQMPCLDMCGSLSKPLFPVKQRYLNGMHLTWNQVFRSLRRRSLLWERPFSFDIPGYLPHGTSLFPLVSCSPHHLPMANLVSCLLDVLRLLEMDIRIYKWMCLCLVPVPMSSELRQFVQPAAILLGTLLTHRHQIMEQSSDGLLSPHSDLATHFFFDWSK